MNAKTFCIYPFVQTVVRSNGGLGPCCLISGLENMQQVTIKDFWNGNKMVAFREKLLNTSESLPACQQCYSLEESNGSSMRTQALSDYKFFNEKFYKRCLKENPESNQLLNESF
jgi:hypothetical protein